MAEWFEGLSQFEAVFLVFLQGSLSHPSLDLFFRFITDLHKNSYFLFLIALPAFFFWFWRERLVALRRFFGLVMTLILIDGFCGQVIKKAIARPRPFETFPEIIQKSPASGFSFVSNHAANMVGLAFFLSYFYPRWKIFWWGIALIVALSRMYNGVHYLSDVISGALIGLSVSWTITRWLDRREKGNKQ